MSEALDNDRLRRALTGSESEIKKEDTDHDLARSERAGVEAKKSRSSEPSSVRKLKIKIKLPEMSCDIGDDRMRNKKGRVEEEIIEHFCSLCGKGFRSRKALGGHMRVHAHRERSDELKTGVDRALYSSEIEDEDEKEDVERRSCDDELVVVMMDGRKKPICSICGRDFPSKKALFGHMRCHPERKWRGIQPPVYISSSTVSDVQGRCSFDKSSDDHDDVMMDSKKRMVDLEKDLINFGWGAKARRGREAIVKSRVSSRSVDSTTGFGNMAEVIAPDQAVGVQSLMMLSRGGFDNNSGKLELKTDDEKRHHQLSSAAPAGVRDSINFWKKLKFCGDEALAAKSRSAGRVDHDSGHIMEEDRGTKRKRKISQLLTAEEVSGLTNSASKKFKFVHEDVVNNDKQGRAAAGIKDVTESDHKLQQMDQGAANGYNAAANNIHDQTKKMHKARKYLMVNDLKAMSANLPHLPPTDHQVNMAASDNERFKCTTCNKSFSSHQALGGHKSSHYKLRNTQGGHINNNTNLDHAGLGFTMPATTPVHPPHQCNICFKTYPTGQALGGHKRLHCSSVISKAPPSQPSVIIPEVVAVLPPLPPPSIIHPEPEAGDAPPPPAAIVTAHAASDHVHESRCRFDLNEMPPLEDDDEVHIAGVIPVDDHNCERGQEVGR